MLESYSNNTMRSACDVSLLDRIKINIMLTDIYANIVTYTCCLHKNQSATCTTNLQLTFFLEMHHISAHEVIRPRVNCASARGYLHIFVFEVKCF